MGVFEFRIYKHTDSSMGLTFRYAVVLQLLLDAGLRTAPDEGADALSFSVELKLPQAVKMLATAAECGDLGNHAGVAYAASPATFLAAPLKRQAGWMPILQSAVVGEQWYSQTCRSLFRRAARIEKGAQQSVAAVHTDGTELVHGHRALLGNTPSIERPRRQCTQQEVWPAIQRHNAATAARTATARKCSCSTLNLCSRSCP